MGQGPFLFHGFRGCVLNMENDIGLDDVRMDVAERGIDQGVDNDTGVPGPGIDGRAENNEVFVGSPAVKGVVVIVLVDPDNQAGNKHHPAGNDTAT